MPPPHPAPPHPSDGRRTAGAHPCGHPTPDLTPAGIVLGAGTVLAPLARGGTGHPSIAIRGREDRILALMSVATWAPAGPGVLAKFHRASRALERGETALALIHLATTLPHGPDPGGRQRALMAQRLALTDRVLTDGVDPETVLAALDLLPADTSPRTWARLVKRYDPDEPRNDHGRWTADGGVSPRPGLHPASDAAGAPVLLASATDAAGLAEVLTAETLKRFGLGTAARLLLGRSNLVARILDPTELGGGPLSGEVNTVPGRPDLSYILEGRDLFISQSHDPHQPPETAYSGTADADGAFRTKDGAVLAHLADGHVVFNDDALPPAEAKPTPPITTPASPPPEDPDGGKKEKKETEPTPQPEPPADHPDPAAVAEMKRRMKLRQDLGDENFTPDGQLKWPDNDGFVETPTSEPLNPHEVVDRYSKATGLDDVGNFVSPEGTPYDARSLPYDQTQMNHTRYEVLKPFNVYKGRAAPAFGQPGGGIQYRTDMNIQQLIKDEFIKEIKP